MYKSSKNYLSWVLLSYLIMIVDIFAWRKIWAHKGGQRGRGEAGDWCGGQSPLPLARISADQRWNSNVVFAFYFSTAVWGFFNPQLLFTNDVRQKNLILVTVGIRSSAKKGLSHETPCLFILGRKEELMTRDGTVSDRAQVLKDEMETINKEQEKLISRDKEVRIDPANDNTASSLIAVFRIRVRLIHS